ncbi:MAG: phospho-sugar mutase, partial [Eubacterium sp.]
KEMDEKYLSRVLEQSVAKDWVKKAADTFAVVYTPFHGSGYRLVPEVLKRDGLKHVITVPEQMVIDGDFPTVKSPNPEFTEGFAMAIDLAEKNNVDLIIGTDPDGDRCGVCVKTDDGYQALTGNQIGVLLLDFLIEARKETGTLAENSAVVKSIVSTSMANRICEVNHIKLFETLTGFKYIGEKIKEFQASGDWTYLFGFEESNGYLAGTYARDKDAVVASMLVAEMACRYKEQRGMNLYQALHALYEKYGFYKEKVASHVMEGLDGREKMDALMAGLRESAPESFGGLKVVRIRDYETGVVTDLKTGHNTATGLPESNVLYYELEDGSAAVIRPSGTEPKVKLYVMVHDDTDAAARKKLDAVVETGMKILQG